MVYNPPKKKSTAGQLFRIAILIILAITVIVSIVKISNYLLQDKFEKLISGEKPFHILVAGIDTKKEAELIFSIRISPDSSQIGLLFLHPDAQLEDDSPTIAKLFSNNDEADVKEALENIFREEIKYIVKINTENAKRIIDILEGIRFYFPSKQENYKKQILFTQSFTHLNGELLLDYVSYLDQNDKRGKVRRIKRQQNILLSLMNQSKSILKIIDNPATLQILLKLLDVSPGFSLEDMSVVSSFFSGEKKKVYLYNFSLELKIENNQEKLLLLKNKSRLSAENFFKKLDTPNGLLNEKNLRVQVLNAVQYKSDGMARRISSYLKMKGIKTILPANYPGAYMENTVILEHSGFPGFALSLAKKLNLSASIVSEDINPDKGIIDATIIIGNDIPDKWKRKK